MSDQKHTPGPWRLNGRVVESPQRMGLSVAQATSGMAAGSRGSARIDEAEARANACLIAAAPDMLAALHSACTGAPDWELITSAIAKAEGRS